MSETTEEAEAWYDVVISAQILGFEGEHEDHPDHVCIKYIDPDNMEVIVDLRYTDLQTLKDHAEILTLASSWLEEVNLHGGRAAMRTFGMESV